MEKSVWRYNIVLGHGGRGGTLGTSTTTKAWAGLVVDSTSTLITTQGHSKILTREREIIMDDFMRVVLEQSRHICLECDRVFDMFDETDAEEWHYGHDCES